MFTVRGNTHPPLVVVPALLGARPPVLQRQRAAGGPPGQMTAVALHLSLATLSVLNLCVLCVSAVPFLCASVVRVRGLVVAGAR
jgi:hypothetical protein